MILCYQHIAIYIVRGNLLELNKPYVYPSYCIHDETRAAVLTSERVFYVTQLIRRDRPPRFSLNWTSRYNSTIYVRKCGGAPLIARAVCAKIVNFISTSGHFLASEVKKLGSCSRIGVFISCVRAPRMKTFILTPCFLLRRWWLDGRKGVRWRARGKVGVGEEVVGPCRLLPKPAEVDLSTRNECARR